MDDKEIRQTIADLVAEEHRLRGQGQGLDAAGRTRLAELEIALDQAWDLLRQRDGARDRGVDPDSVHARPPGEVESYLQ
ncbi:MAG TPA: DUF2630 family protein [Actinomycetes bacterium]|nr:DUF2630 family protein [Actinomycetes bacterium]